MHGSSLLEESIYSPVHKLKFKFFWQLKALANEVAKVAIYMART